jgi:uncharacterized cupin superfamily protein
VTVDPQRAVRLDTTATDLLLNSGADRLALRNEVIGAIDKAQLKDAPIQPAWILEGSPKTRVKVLSDGSTDGSAFTVMWDCTAGRFNWFYDVDETVFILEGAVTLTLPSGTTRRLTAGSTYFFAHGTRAEWHVDQYIRKVAFCHSPMSAKLRLAKRLFCALKRLGRPGSSADERTKMFDAA